MNAKLLWAGAEADRRAAAAFFARIVALSPAYISHGEVQTALSLDGRTWAPNLEARYTRDLLAHGPTRQLLLARDDGGALVGASVVCWDFEEPEAPFATIEDLAVEPAWRSRGLGAEMLAFIETEARKRGAKWLFLESGKDNARAHAFFEREGFAEISHVFTKRLA